MDNPSVNILLSTYNGERHLACQLDSLLAQDYPNFAVHVRDDGSSDGTVAILRRFAAASSRIVFHEDGCGVTGNIGYKRSFRKLLERCGDADFFAFCDQDDFWLPAKVSRGVAALEGRDASRPLLYAASFRYCDADLTPEGSPPAPRGEIRFPDTVFFTAAFGFSILGNRALRDEVVGKGTGALDEIPHDCLCENLAALLGEYIYDPEPLALYRRHAGTVTYSTGSRFSLVRKWLANDIFGRTMDVYRGYVTALHGVYGGSEAVSAADRRFMDLFRQRRVTPCVYLRRLFYPRRLRPTRGGELALRICFALSR